MTAREGRLLDCCTTELEDTGELDLLHENRPGLPALSYRLGRHGDFFHRMLARLPRQRPATDTGAAPPLGRLTYRGEDDPTVALLDACSSMLDVLGFYQERIVNEGFIRTALERRSVLELARSIGYEMRPGVAASTLLTFTVDEAAGSPDRVVVPVGTQVLSIPKKDELPQTFETVEEIEARVEWNELPVQAPWVSLRQSLETGSTKIFLDRTGARLARGDVLLLLATDKATGAEQRLLRRVHRVTDVPGRGYRCVELQPTGVTPAESRPLDDVRVFGFGLQTRFLGHDARVPVSGTVTIKRVLIATIQTKVTCVALASRESGLAASGFEAAPDVLASELIQAQADYYAAVLAEDVLAPEQQATVGDALQSLNDAMAASNDLLRRTIRVWDLEAGAESQALDTVDTVTAIAFSSDDRYLAAATMKNTGELALDIWELDTGAHVVSSAILLEEDMGHQAPVQRILFHGSDTGDAYQLTTIDPTQIALAWDFHPDGNASGNGDPDLSSTQRLNLSLLGDVAGDPLRAEDDDRALFVGDEAGSGEPDSESAHVTRYRAVQLLDAIPDQIVLEQGQIDLDGVYRKVIPGGWALLVEPTKTAAYPIEAVTTPFSETDFGVSKRVTRLGVNLGEAQPPPAFSLRETEIYAESEELDLAAVPIALPEPVLGTELVLTEPVEGLAGRTVIVAGRRVLPGDAGEAPGVTEGSAISAVSPDGTAVQLTVTAVDSDQSPLRVEDENGFAADLDGDTQLVLWDDEADVVYEVARVESVNDNGDSPPTLTLVEPLKNVYDWRSVRIFANVAPATHGETVTEVLGSGDGLTPNQRFKLGKPPLTFVPGANASGRASTLQVRVNGVLWSESDSLLQTKSADETFIVRIQNDGLTEVTFGDGLRGARLPSGIENVTAVYRSGLGPEGEVEAGQLALLKTKPLGILGVNNPLPATGAALPESESETRENAPRTVLVLGRVVSIQDYEDFSKTYPGVGKARAASMWDGFDTFVHLTVGTEGGASLIPGSPLHVNLLGALDNVRDTHQLVLIDGYKERRFGLRAKILIDPRYEAERVLSEVRRHLEDAFSYDARDFGQDVTAAEVVAVIHRCDGVVAVDLDALYFVGEEPPSGSGSKAPTQHLDARLAHLSDNEAEPAELLLIDPGQIHLEVMS